MKAHLIAAFSLLLPQSVMAIALHHQEHQKPPLFVLTGDSTVAADGGWGNGFLADTKQPASGINLAKQGATTASFRSEGLWDQAIESVRNNTECSSPIVTIQFGHNDQKEASGISPETFKSNLKRMANEVFGAGGTPVIITSLTRRTFNNGFVVENLALHSNLAIEAAEAVGAQYFDLNKVSTVYINAIGHENADYYNYKESDRTHLNPKGEIVFGRMVVDLLLEKRKDLTRYFRPNRALSFLLKNGEFATGDE